MREVQELCLFRLLLNGACHTTGPAVQHDCVAEQLPEFSCHIRSGGVLLMFLLPLIKNKKILDSEMFWGEGMADGEEEGRSHTALFWRITSGF